MSIAFEWDERKAETNLQKHGVAFSLAILVWDDMQLRIVEADARPEPRWMAIGTVLDRVLTVVFTQSGDTIRVISARPASRKERATYASP
ncbi:BrnT family toxin [Gemmatimonas sp.]|uniref:BrnT family toxin n=1 Tax=Gemmatimonas sp. TaxID=1962908 RepID=UPI003DA58CF5